jgi:hypothetical protein
VAHPVSDLELASRLSFFIWSSIPDDELLEVAASGQLHQTGVLERQVRRMMADSRSQSLVDNFASQWLCFRRPPFSSGNRGLLQDGLGFPGNSLAQFFAKQQHSLQAGIPWLRGNSTRIGP